jgi:hypothetical protein
MVRSFRQMRRCVLSARAAPRFTPEGHPLVQSGSRRGSSAQSRRGDALDEELLEGDEDAEHR